MTERQLFAEDAFQDTFLALARFAGTIKHGEAIGPWLRRVALRRALKARLKASQRRVRERNRADSRNEIEMYIPANTSGPGTTMKGPAVIFRRTYRPGSVFDDLFSID